MRNRTTTALLAVILLLLALKSSAATPTPATKPLVQITWDALSCSPFPCGACWGPGGDHEQEAISIDLLICCKPPGELLHWLLDPVRASDVGTTYVADPSTVATFAERLGDGIEQDLSLDQSVNGGSFQSTVSEGLVFAGLDHTWIHSKVFVSPANGIDYQGFAIDALENHLAALCLEYNPAHDKTWLGVRVLTTIYGRRGDLDSDNQIGATDLELLLAGWGPCPAPPESCLSDLNDDGMSGVNDLLILLANWG